MNKRVMASQNDYTESEKLGKTMVETAKNYPYPRGLFGRTVYVADSNDVSKLVNRGLNNERIGLMAKSARVVLTEDIASLFLKFIEDVREHDFALKTVYMEQGIINDDDKPVENDILDSARSTGSTRSTTPVLPVPPQLPVSTVNIDETADGKLQEAQEVAGQLQVAIHAGYQPPAWAFRFIEQSARYKELAEHAVAYSIGKYGEQDMRDLLSHRHMNKVDGALHYDPTLQDTYKVDGYNRIYQTTSTEITPRLPSLLAVYARTPVGPTPSGNVPDKQVHVISAMGLDLSTDDQTDVKFMYKIPLFERKEFAIQRLKRAYRVVLHCAREKGLKSVVMTSMLRAKIDIFNDLFATEESPFDLLVFPAIKAALELFEYEGNEPMSPISGSVLFSTLPFDEVGFYWFTWKEHDELKKLVGQYRSVKYTEIPERTFKPRDRGDPYIFAWSDLVPGILRSQTIDEKAPYTIAPKSLLSDEATLYHNPWNHDTVVGGGHLGDLTMNGGIGSITALMFLSWPYTNPYLKRQYLFTDIPDELSEYEVDDVVLAGGERNLTAKRQLQQFVHRLLSKRPYVDIGTRDDVYLRESGERKRLAAAGNEEALLMWQDEEYLQSYLAYEEMELSSLITVSSETIFINSGGMRNNAVPLRANKAAEMVPWGVLVGQSGPRLNRDMLFEAKYLLHTRDEAAGSDHTARLWDIMNDHVYGTKLVDKKEAEKRGWFTIFRRAQLPFFNAPAYEARVALMAGAFIQAAESHGNDGRQTVMCDVTGVGLEEKWILREHVLPMKKMYIKQFLKEFNDLSDTSKIKAVRFSAFLVTGGDVESAMEGVFPSFPSIQIDDDDPMPEQNFEFVLPNQIKVMFWNRTQYAEPVHGLGHLLVAQYNTHPNAFPGNEYWIGRYNEPGSSRVASSLASQLHSPHFNPAMSADNLRIDLPQIDRKIASPADDHDALLQQVLQTAQAGIQGYNSPPPIGARGDNPQLAKFIEQANKACLTGATEESFEHRLCRIKYLVGVLRAQCTSQREVDPGPSLDEMDSLQRELDERMKRIEELEEQLRRGTGSSATIDDLQKQLADLNEKAAQARARAASVTARAPAAGDTGRMAKERKEQEERRKRSQEIREETRKRAADEEKAAEAAEQLRGEKQRIEREKQQAEQNKRLQYRQEYRVDDTKITKLVTINQAMFISRGIGAEAEDLTLRWVAEQMIGNESDFPTPEFPDEQVQIGVRHGTERLLKDIGKINDSVLRSKVLTLLRIEALSYLRSLVGSDERFLGNSENPPETKDSFNQMIEDGKGVLQRIRDNPANVFIELHSYFNDQHQKVIRARAQVLGKSKVFVLLNEHQQSSEPRIASIGDEGHSVSIGGARYGLFERVQSNAEWNDPDRTALKPLLEAIESKNAVVVYGMGFSGSGKTTALTNSYLDTSGNGVRSIVEYASKTFGYTLERAVSVGRFVTVNHNRGGPQPPTMNRTRTTVDTYEPTLSTETVKQDLEKSGLIMSTMNNPNSSRAATLYYYTVAEGPPLIIIDLPGQEDVDVIRDDLVRRLQENPKQVFREALDAMMKTDLKYLASGSGMSLGWEKLYAVLLNGDALQSMNKDLNEGKLNDWFDYTQYLFRKGLDRQYLPLTLHSPGTPSFLLNTTSPASWVNPKLTAYVNNEFISPGKALKIELKGTKEMRGTRTCGADLQDCFDALYQGGVIQQRGTSVTLPLPPKMTHNMVLTIAVINMYARRLFETGDWANRFLDTIILPAFSAPPGNVPKRFNLGLKPGLTVAKNSMNASVNFILRTLFVDLLKRKGYDKKRVNTLVAVAKNTLQRDPQASVHIDATSSVLGYASTVNANIGEIAIEGGGGYEYVSTEEFLKEHPEFLEDRDDIDMMQFYEFDDPQEKEELTSQQSEEQDEADEFNSIDNIDNGVATVSGREEFTLDPQFPTYALRGTDALFMHKIAPKDRELSFTLNFEEGHLEKIHAMHGGACIEGGACTVKPCMGAVCAHSHPKGNRISSSDLAVALSLHPQMGGKRRISLVLGPSGLFGYAPTNELVQKWKTMNQRERDELQEEWRTAGLQQQSNTQKGKMQSLHEYLKKNGWRLTYTPWKNIHPTDTLLFQV